MLTELLTAAGGDFATARWTPCPPASDRGVWDALPCFDRWLYGGNEVLRQKAPALPLTLWAEFTKTGNRARFEHAYFARRRTLCRLAMAECAGYAGQYLPAIADYAWAICEESAWNLPAHNSYRRGAPQEPLPDPARPIVDLFAAETGALLATLHYLLGRELDAAYPGLRARMAREVERRVLKPWRTTHFWWMGDGEEPMCNWTPWCTQNVLIAEALLHGGSPARLRAAVAQGAYSLDCFLKDYGPDGCCNEGAQYYRHAGLCLYNALELLCALAPGVFDAVWREPKLKNLAEYIVNMHIDGEYYLNFADCSPKAGARGVREYLFGKRVGSAPLMALAAADFAAGGDRDNLFNPDDSEGINLFYHLQIALAEPELLAYAKARHDCRPANAWYPSVGLLCTRAGAFAAGIKAGCNADSHNHNDVGSVTLYKNGRPLLIDIGVESYTKKTFSPQRYEIWTMQSAWHNLPVFDPRGAAYQQQPGEEFAACAVAPLPDLAGLAMDIAPAYGAVPGLGYYRRRAVLDETGLEITDETDYPGEVALTLMSVEKPETGAGRINFGGLAAARVEAGGAVRMEVEAVPVRDPRLRLTWPDTLYRTRVFFRTRAKICIG